MPKNPVVALQPEPELAQESLGLEDTAHVFFNASGPWLQAQVKEGKIPSLKIGEKRIFVRRHIEAWLDEQLKIQQPQFSHLIGDGTEKPK